MHPINVGDYDFFGKRHLQIQCIAPPRNPQQGENIYLKLQATYEANYVLIRLVQTRAVMDQALESTPESLFGSFS